MRMLINSLLISIVCNSFASAQVPLVFGTAQPVPGFPETTGGHDTGRSLNYVSPDGTEMLFQEWSPVWRVFGAHWDSAEGRWGPVDTNGNVVTVDFGFPNWSGGATLSPDKQTMYYGDLSGIHRATWTGSGWNTETNVYPTLANRGYLYFNGSYMYGIENYRDLWSFKYNAADGTFAPGMSLDSLSSGDTKSGEWVSSDNTLMIFSSDRPGGYGGYDLWSASWNTTTNQWTDITNLGPNVNTEYDEASPKLAGTILYFDRYFDQGDWSHGSRQLMQSIVPEPSTMILLGAGAISLLAYVWRRRRHTA